MAISFTTPSHLPAEGLTAAVTPAGVAAAPDTLQQWLAAIAAEQKSEALFELEMWIRCFDRFFRVKNHPLSEQETREVVRRDFGEEMRIVRSVGLRLSQLCADLLSVERVDSLNFTQYVESALRRDDSAITLAEHLTAQLTPEDSLAFLMESLADLRPVMDGLTQLHAVNFQTFTSVGKLINRELQRCRFIAPLLGQKFKPQYDRIQHPEITAIIKSIRSQSLRQDLAQVFLEAFRLLRYLRFIGADLEADRSLKRSLLIFALINAEANSLLDFIDRRVLTSPDLTGEPHEIIDGCSYALKMDLNKVFGRELVGFVHLRQAPPIYAKVENSHGLLRNCVQQTVIGIANAFDPSVKGAHIFGDFQTLLDQSCRLRADLWRLICYVRHFEARPEKGRVGRLIDELASFRDGSMKFLMFRDWDQLEVLHEEVIAARSEADLQKVLHRFLTYLETLLGQVNLRAVLAEHPFDYPPVEVGE
jgi:hypothetical protein